MSLLQKAAQLDIQNKVIVPSNILSAKLGWLCRGGVGKKSVSLYHSDYHNGEPKKELCF